MMTRKVLNKRAVWALLVLLAFSRPDFALANTGVGHGGDILTSYLKSVRFSFKKALASILDDKPSQESLCLTVTDLTPLQRIECRSFLMEAMPQMLNLAAGDPFTPFTITIPTPQDPFTVSGPDGRPMPVDARTQLGPEGAIDFNFNRIQHYPPQILLKLMSHEFGHKVSYRGAFVEDHPSVGAYSTGRELLDTAATAITQFAQSKGIVGTAFLLNDRFHCNIDLGGGLEGVPISGQSQRIFKYSGSYDAFDTSISKLPMDLPISVNERGGRSSLVFRVQIHEETGCREDSRGRATSVELVRVYREIQGQVTPADEILSSELLEGVNPICEENPRTLAVKYGNLTFGCTYGGSTGNTY